MSDPSSVVRTQSNYIPSDDQTRMSNSSGYFVYHPKLKPFIKRIPYSEEVSEQLHEKLNIAGVEARKRIGKLK